MAEGQESRQGGAVTDGTAAQGERSHKRLRLVAFAAIVVGLIIRTTPLLTNPSQPLSTCDGRAYHSIAVSLVRGEGFYLGDPALVALCLNGVQLGPSHHFAPGLPIIEALFVGALGDTPVALVIPLILLSWLAVLTAFWTTGNLFGVDAALLVGAAVSLDWTGSFYGTFLGYSENLVLIAITVTLWAILRALRDDRFVLWAGVFAGIGYLSKASIGWFFLIAGAGGFIYRLRFRGRSVLRNQWYWGAVVIFTLPVALWSYRNLSWFWDGSLAGLIDSWQTSSAISHQVANALSQPAALLSGLIGKLPVLAGLFLLPYLPFAGSLWRQLRQWRQEEPFGLWLAVGLIFILGWLFAAVFWVNERTSLLWADNVRYVMPASIPLLWLVVRDQERSTIRWTVCFAILLAMCLLPPVFLLRA